MEKQLSVLGYWLGVICLVLAVIFRICIAFSVDAPRLGSATGLSVSYVSFFHGAALFFLLSIASWCQKSIKS